MTQGDQWPLEKIRAAYREVLQAYDSLFPLHPEKKIESGHIADPIERSKGDQD